MQEFDETGMPLEREEPRKAVGAKAATSGSQVPNSYGVNSQTEPLKGGRQKVPERSTFRAVMIG